MAGNPKRSELARMRKNLLDEGYVDDQFIGLEELQVGDIPNFAEEVVTVFFMESARLLHIIQQILMEEPLPNFGKLYSCLHRFKGSCSSIGAKRLEIECTQMREACKPGNIEGLRRSFPQLRRECETLKEKLVPYFQLARIQPGPSSGTACTSSK